MNRQQIQSLTPGDAVFVRATRSGDYLAEGDPQRMIVLKINKNGVYCALYRSRSVKRYLQNRDWNSLIAIASIYYYYSNNNILYLCPSAISRTLREARIEQAKAKLHLKRRRLFSFIYDLNQHAKEHKQLKYRVNSMKGQVTLCQKQIAQLVGI